MKKDENSMTVLPGSLHAHFRWIRLHLIHVRDVLLPLVSETDDRKSVSRAVATVDALNETIDALSPESLERAAVVLQ